MVLKTVAVDNNDSYFYYFKKFKIKLYYYFGLYYNTINIYTVINIIFTESKKVIPAIQFNYRKYSKTIIHIKYYYQAIIVT